ncbi:MAG: hypothetical protein AAF655_12545 [Bacteroidota bacterium]
MSFQINEVYKTLEKEYKEIRMLFADIKLSQQLNDPEMLPFFAKKLKASSSQFYAQCCFHLDDYIKENAEEIEYIDNQMKIEPEE